MKAFVAIVHGLSRLCGVIAVGLLVAAVLVVCEMVVMRYFLGRSTVWQTEFVTYSLVGATFIGSPYVLLMRGHVNVDLVPLYLGNRARLWLAVVAYTMALIFVATVAWASFEMWLEAWTKGWRTDTVWSLPLWIAYLPMPLGLGLLALQYVADLAGLFSGRVAPFDLAPDERL